jgi:hypothetical protein
MAGMGFIRVRIANLPPEVPDGALPTVLARCGEVKDIQAETWSPFYRFSVVNGIRLAMITLPKHNPSHIIVAGNRVLVSYEGKPITCYGCNSTGHLYQACPLRRSLKETAPTTTSTSLAGRLLRYVRMMRIEYRIANSPSIKLQPLKNNMLYSFGREIWPI